MGEKLIHIYELEKLDASTIVFLILGGKHRVYCAGSELIGKYLISDAKHRLQIMRKNSPIVGKVIAEHHALRHIPENASPLDILAIQ